MNPEKVKEISKRFPVKSSTPCRYFNFLANALCWEQQFESNRGFRSSYLKSSDDATRFRLAEEFFKNILKLDVQPDVIFNGKVLEKAEVARQKGNSLFAHGDLHGALAAYNESILYSPGDNDAGKMCLALAVGNRSAVFYRLQRFAECIRDVEQAVIYGYPVESVKKLLTRKANAYLAVGRPDDAVFTLETEGSLLKICAGGIDEILKLDGDMKDYAKTLNVALKAQDTKNKDVDGGKPELKFKFPTGWDRKEEVKKLGLRDGHGKLFSSLSAVVDFQRMKNRVKFVAEQDIDAGDVLLVEQTFVSSIDQETCTTNCYACLCWTDAPLPCSNCSAVVFCTPACASSSKAAVHARECSFWFSLCCNKHEAQQFTPNFATDINMNFRQYAFTALRMILTLPKEKWVALIDEQLQNRSESSAALNFGKRRYRDDDLMDVFWLTNFGEAWRQVGAKTEHNPMVFFVAVFLTKLLETEFFSDCEFSEKMRRQLGGIVIRALIVCQRDKTVPLLVQDPYSNDREQDAPVLLPVYSQFTRSCIPNMLGVFHGDQIVVRARRPIKKGGILTVAYNFSTYPHYPLEVREYLFSLASLGKCRCQACSDDWPVLTEVEKQFRTGSTKLKCPYCSHVLGASIRCFEEPGFLWPGCPKCKVDEQTLKSRLGEIMKQNGFKTVAEKISAMNHGSVEGMLERVRSLSLICVEPSYLLLDADELLESAVLRSGNRRYHT